MTVNQNDYQNILNDVNFIGGAGKDDLSTVSGELDQRADIGIDSEGDYQFYYYSLTSISDLNALGYYTSGVDREYTQLPSAGPALSSDQSAMLSDVLSSSTWGGSFSDIAKIDFNSGTTANADIVIGVTTNGGTPAVTSNIGGYELDYTSGWGALKHGDIWLNNDGTSYWDETDIGAPGQWAILHEVSHSLGIDIYNDDLTARDPNLDSQKYTVTSYIPLDGMNPSGPNNEVLPTGLQLFDIAAIQAIYGANTATRNENMGFDDGDADTTGTLYSKMTAFASTRPNDAFIYTIWDGGGDTDTIDASDYTDGVTIDLNEGAFSSIGKLADSSFDAGRGAGLAVDNVAIAYDTEIENAVGTAQSDQLTGNDLNNILTGGGSADTLDGGLGDDELHGGSGNDEYIFELGYGEDTVYEDFSSDNTFSFGAGITAQNLNYIREADNLVLEANSSDRLILNDYFTFQNDLEDQLEFSDNSTVNLIIEDGSEIHGSSQDDIIFGGDGNNTIRSYQGNDIIYGGAGNDYIPTAEATNNIVYGEDGDDTIAIDRGESVVYGGNGNDWITTRGTGFYSGGDGDDRMTVFLQIDIPGTYFDVETGDGNDNFFSSGLDNPNTPSVPLVNILDTSGNDLFTLGNADFDITDHNGNDVYNLWGTLAHEIAQSISIQDQGGIDELRSNNLNLVDVSSVTNVNNDLVITVLGKDYTIEDHFLNSNNQLEYINLKDTDLFDPTLLMSPDNIFGNLSNNFNLSGNVNDNFILGFSGNDYLYGNAGNDTLIGGYGNDYLSDTSGDDSYVFDDGDGQDTIDDAHGQNDFIRLGAGILQSDITISQVGNNLEITFVNNASDKITILDHYDTGQTNQIEKIVFDDLSEMLLTDPLPIIGTPGNDTLTGTPYGEEISGLAGDDVINAGDGDDIIDGGDDDDTIDGEGGIDTIDYDTTSARVYVSLDNGYAIENWDGSTNGIANATDTLANIENVTGGDYADKIYGNNVANILSGGIGSDVIEGFDGNDTILGGDDADLLYGDGDDDMIIGGEGDDLIRGGDGNDIINLGNVTLANIQSLDNSETHIQNAYGGAGDDIIYGSGEKDFIEGEAGNDTIYAGNGNNKIWGGDGDDTVYGGDDLDTAYLGAGNDYFEGGAENDRAYGEAGDDTLIGDTFQDFLYGGDDNDTIYGGDNADYLYGDYGMDTIYGDNHNDRIEGGDGADTLHGGAGSDTIYGDFDHTNVLGGNDIINGDNGADTVQAGAGDDTVNGGNQNDALYGNTGNDTLNGENHDDLLSGEEGDDTLNGGSGVDTLYGGDGADTLIGGSGQDFLYAGNDSDVDVFGFSADEDSEDRIYNFELLEDQIDVSDLLTGYTPGASDIDDFVSIAHVGSRFDVRVDSDGGADNFISIARVLTDIDNSLTAQDLLNNGTLIA